MGASQITKLKNESKLYCESNSSRGPTWRRPMSLHGDQREITGTAT